LINKILIASTLLFSQVKLAKLKGSDSEDSRGLLSQRSDKEEFVRLMQQHDLLFDYGIGNATNSSLEANHIAEKYGVEKANSTLPFPGIGKFLHLMVDRFVGQGSGGGGCGGGGGRHSRVSVVLIPTVYTGKSFLTDLLSKEHWK
jgi:hypothetical protein